ncbi:hypothetical protein HPB49_002045 [Dermacentor silvarum]|uniref:Uncharacterized protein n=1 Tax=Dermacentor silvarum TaxID=543639 RepID=A0ACB8CP14_DERSI|nr:hypothetical protein HPB49_002045 [Dermacentor silvarum]
MGKKCSFFLQRCKSGYETCTEKVSLFAAPRETDHLKIWHHAILRKDHVLQSTDYVCEKHFETTYVMKIWEGVYKGLVLFDFGQLSTRPNRAPHVKEPCRSLGEAVRRTQANMSLEMETVEDAAPPDELSSGGTWFIRRKNRFTPEHGDTSAVREPTGSGTRPNPRLGKKQATRSV